MAAGAETAIPITQRRVYVVCPGDVVTGGPELLHQLVHALRQEGRDASIAYYPLRAGWKTPEPYLRYGCPVADTIPDEEDCAVVVPEVNTSLLYRFQRAHHVVWWLSVDYYRGSFSASGWRTKLRRLVRSDIPSAPAATHLFQSAYAREYVRQRLRCPGFMLSDYIPDDFFVPGQGGARRDAVAFNPKKGMAFTREFMRLHPDIACVPLQGLTRAGMRETLDTCKVYIDFGNHPGKDRIPREAALRGAVVFVGRRGSAANDEDLPIDPIFKVEPDSAGAMALGLRLREVFADHASYSRRQDPYRAMISAEASVFRRDVRRAFACAGGGTSDGAREPGATPQSRVLGVVVTYNPEPSPALLPAHLAALRAQCDVLVVDNGSRNSDWVAACARAAGCTVVLNPGNVGIAAALNQGLRLAVEQGFGWLATFDQDSLPPEGAIAGLLQFCAEHPDGGRTGVVSVAHRDRVTGRDYHHRSDILSAGAGGRQLRTTITSGSMVRVDLLRALGGFEESLFIDVVDHELCLRVRKAGWLVMEDPRFVMEHSIGSASVHSLLGRTVVCTNHSPARLYYRARNQFEISRRYASFDPLWAAKGVMQLANTAAAVALFERDRGRKLRAMLRGAFDFARRRFGPAA